MHSVDVPGQSDGRRPCGVGAVGAAQAAHDVVQDAAQAEREEAPQVVLGLVGGRRRAVGRLRPDHDDVGTEPAARPLPQELGSHGLEGVLLLGAACLVQVLLQVLARAVGDRPVSRAVAPVNVLHALSYNACVVRDGYAADHRRCPHG